jgi:hypothetical protein
LNRDFYYRETATILNVCVIDRCLKCAKNKVKLNQRYGFKREKMMGTTLTLNLYL